MRKLGLLRLKTSIPGFIEWPMGMFGTLMLVLVLIFSLEICRFRACSMYMEDALACSNLAGALVDMEYFGITDELLITDQQRAYSEFIRALKINLDLDEDMKCQSDGLISGEVSVRQFIVYNRQGGSITAMTLEGGVVTSTVQGPVGTISSPQGTVVDSTGIYSEIEFPVSTFTGVCLSARKGQLVDVVRN